MDDAFSAAKKMGKTSHFFKMKGYIGMANYDK